MSNTNSNQVSKSFIQQTIVCQTFMKNPESFDSGLLTGMVFIDLQKAFDTTNHNILIEKSFL